MIASSHLLPSSSGEDADFIAAVRHFADSYVRSRAVDLDRAPADDYDWGLVQVGTSIGLMRMGIPKEFGGLGISAVDMAAVMEELAAADPGVALTFGASGLFQIAVLLSADARLQARYLTPFIGDEPVLGCNAVTEELAGLDLILPENAAYARDVMEARREGDHYLLNGTKKFISNGPMASYASVFANMAGHPGATGLTCFIVDLDQPGVVRGPVSDKMGYRSCPSGELTFLDVVVPVENVVGGELAGWHLNVSQGNIARIMCAAISTGIARAALDKAIAWCGERVQGGKKLYQHQFSAGLIAQMTAKVDAARLMYLNAARIADGLTPCPEHEPAVAKLFADRAAIEVADAATSLLGARGYVRDYGMEKILRDSYGPRIYEGSWQALSILITEGIYRTGGSYRSKEA
jgi:alkylation response protein AidB-like acyl-CoA dehydrogenase